MTVTRVNGGIINDQMLNGGILNFKIVGALANAVSDGTITLDGTETRGGSTPVTTYFLIGENRPVPNSLAEHIIGKLQDKCTVVRIGFVGAPGAETEMHLAISASGFGWIDASGAVDTAAMVAAIDVGNITVPDVTASADTTNTPVTASVSTTVTVTEVPFILA